MPAATLPQNTVGATPSINPAQATQQNNAISGVPQGLDPKAYVLTKALALQENGGKLPDINNLKPGASGELPSVYQYTPDTWKAVAGKYLGDPNAPINPTNENQATYLRVENWLQQGYSPAQIASMHNAGEGAPNAYLGNKGVNKEGVAYDTSKYAQGVQKYAQELWDGSYQPPQQPSFFGNLSQDFSRRGQNISDASARQGAGEQGLGSTALQDVGQLAGGIGDVFSEALGAADRVLTGGAVGNALGSAVHAIGQTAPAQDIYNAYEGFKQAHPVAAANVEALGNIASVLPIGGAAEIGGKTLAEQAAKAGESEIAQNLSKGAISGIKSNLEDVLSGTKPLANAYDYAASRGFDPARVLAERKLIPDIVDGKLAIPEDSKVITSLEKEVATKSTTLDTALSKYRTTQNVDQLKQAVADEISHNLEFRQQGLVPEMTARAESIIDNYATQEGKSKFRLIDIQNMKKGQSALSSKFRKSLDFGKADEHSAVASALRKVIENEAPDLAVRKLNQKVGELETTLDLLHKANGTAVRGGRLGRYGARILGATIGSQGHVPIISPIVGAFLGDAIVTGIQKAKIAGPLNRLLMRVAQVAPDNQVVNDTLDFIQKVERGEKVMPTDDVAEFIARLTVKANIPLLPEPVQKEFRSIIGTGPAISLPEKSQSSLDQIERVNPNIKTPEIGGAPEYLYHGTNEYVLDRILIDGLKPMRRGLLSLSKDETYAKSFAREGATPQGKTGAVLLRVKADALNGKTVSSDVARPASDELHEILTKETIPPESIEIKINGKWIPLSKITGSGTSIPKELQPLAAEARKYGSAEEFKKAVSGNQAIYDPAYEKTFDPVRASAKPFDFDLMEGAETKGDMVKVYRLTTNGRILPGDNVSVHNLERYRRADGGMVVAAKMGITKLYENKNVKLVQQWIPKKDLYQTSAGTQLYAPNGMKSLTDFYNKATGRSTSGQEPPKPL